MTALQYFAKRRFNYVDTYSLWLITTLSYSLSPWVWLAIFPCALLSAWIECRANVT